MGLFENLFKPRPEGSVERVVEAPLKASSLLRKTVGADEGEGPDPQAAFLQPKGYAAEGTNESVSGPQGFSPVMPSGRRPPASARRAPVEAPSGDQIILVLADVLPRIPVAFLRPGPHDAKRELRFRHEDLSAAIARGRPGIALSCIAEQCPDIFAKRITDDDDMEVRLPLQKLVEQVSRIRSRAGGSLPPASPTPPAPRPALDAAAEKLKPGPLTARSAVRNIMPASPEVIAKALQRAAAPVNPPAPVPTPFTPPVVAPPSPAAPAPPSAKAAAPTPVAPPVAVVAPPPPQVPPPVIPPAAVQTLPPAPAVSAPPELTVPVTLSASMPAALSPPPVVVEAVAPVAPAPVVSAVLVENPPAPVAATPVLEPLVPPPVLTAAEAPVPEEKLEPVPVEASLPVPAPSLPLEPVAPPPPPPVEAAQPVPASTVTEPLPGLNGVVSHEEEVIPSAAQPLIEPPQLVIPVEAAPEAPALTPPPEPVAAPTVPDLPEAAALPPPLPMEPAPVEAVSTPAPAPAAPALEAVIPPAPVAPPVEEPVPPAPVEDTAAEPPEGMIGLSLAAIVARAPLAVFAGEKPRIEETHRINLPFPMIERQLGTGAVSVPAALFWSALPPSVQPLFVAPEGVSVPIPLEEIFTNLPVAREYRQLMASPEARPIRAFTAPLIQAPTVPAPSAEVLAPVHAPVEPPAATPPPPADEVPSPVEAPAPVAPSPEPPPILPASAEVPSENLENQRLEPTVPTDVAPPPSAVNEAPPSEPAPAMNLAPFHAFTPPSPTVEADREEPVSEAVVLGEAPAATDHPGDAAQVLRPADLAEPGETVASEPSGAESAQEDGPMPPPVASPLSTDHPEEPTPRFAVLPPPDSAPLPEPVAVELPAPETLAAFNPDLPPPIKIEVPAAAVAELRATVNAGAAPAAEALYAAASTSVPPPRLFRPVMLPPPIASGSAPVAENPAPTLSGHGTSPEGMISLVPSPEMPAEPFRFPANRPVPPPEPIPAAVAVTPSEPEPAEPVPVPVAPAPASAVPPPPSMIPAAVTAPAVPAAPAALAAPTPQSLAHSYFTPPPASEAAVVTPPAAPVNPAPVVTPAAPTPPAAFIPPAQAAPVAFPVPPPAPEPKAPAKPELPHPTFHLPPPPAPVPAPVHDTSVPALAITRLDQHSLQSLFMTEEILDLPKIARLAAGLPGIQACVIVSRGETYSCGGMPEGFHISALRGLAPQVGAAADLLPLGSLKNFTLYGEQFSISFFERSGVSLCAIHRARSFVPGVREKLVAVVDELARA